MAVVGVLVAFMGLAAVMLAVGVLAWIVSSAHERWIWRDGDEPRVPSRVYIDERYGGADADATRLTGYISPPSLTAMRLCTRYPRLADSIGRGPHRSG